MKFNKSFSLKNTLWIYLTVFSILILFFLWFFQIIFLDEYYESYKTKEIKAAALKIKFKYDKNKDLTVIEMLKLIYEKYKDTEYDLLDDFMLWLKINEEK